MVAQEKQNIGSVITGASEEMIEYMRQDFLDTTRDKLREIEGSLAEGADLDALRYSIFEIKGQARNFGMSLLGIIALRLEDYLNAIDEVSVWSEPGIRAFLDVMTGVISGGIAEDEDPSLIVRGLPARPRVLGVDDNDVLDVDVMLVMEHSAQTTFVERELQACGYRTNIVSSPFEAFEQVVRVRPDMVIVSGVLPDLSGVDLATALATMPETRNTPVAVLTNQGDDSGPLTLLPKSVPVIHRGDSFGDDLAKAMSHHFLL